MTEVKLIQSEDFSGWDEYVKQHGSASAYHRIAWMQAVENGYNHKCFYWIARQSDGTVVGILPSVLIAPPLSKASLCALPFCDLGGILADSNEIHTLLLNQALQFCKEENISVFDNRSSIKSEASLDVESLPATKVRMLMQLPEDSDTLFSGFKSKLRSQIRKSEKNGLIAKTGNSLHFVNEFYQVFTRNMRDLGSPVHSNKWFEQIISSYGEDAVIATIYSEEQVVGAGIVLFNGDKACIPWASTNSDFNRLAPNMLLYWTLLKYVNDRGCKEFDFGRSTIGEGTFKFKSQWGAKPELLNWQKYNYSGQLIEDTIGEVSNLRLLVEKTWRKLPVNVSEFIGPKIRKYISL
ncbi:MAG: FemAB family PEP-CTERM system-associated protein [Colwellia sp.]|nr:FemAB family PEP-CTERM system-associated protein [Colwellia sp.]